MHTVGVKKKHDIVEAFRPASQPAWHARGDRGFASRCVGVDLKSACLKRFPAHAPTCRWHWHAHPPALLPQHAGIACPSGDHCAHVSM